MYLGLFRSQGWGCSGESKSWRLDIPRQPRIECLSPWCLVWCLAVDVLEISALEASEWNCANNRVDWVVSCSWQRLKSKQCRSGQFPKARWSQSKELDSLGQQGWKTRELACCGKSSVCLARMTSGAKKRNGGSEEESSYYEHSRNRQKKGSEWPEVCFKDWVNGVLWAWATVISGKRHWMVVSCEVSCWCLK